jgi:hypothetical protein
VIILTRKIGATMESTIIATAVALRTSTTSLFLIPEPSGSIQAKRGENEMPGIEEAQKQDKVQHLHPHGNEGGKRTEFGQVPNPDRCYHIREGKYSEIRQYKRLNQEPPAGVCHRENHL